MRAVLGTRIFNFESVLNRDEMDEEYLIMAVEEV